MQSCSFTICYSFSIAVPATALRSKGAMNSTYFGIIINCDTIMKSPILYSVLNRWLEINRAAVWLLRIQKKNVRNHHFSM